MLYVALFLVICSKVTNCEKIYFCLFILLIILSQFITTYNLQQNDSKNSYILRAISYAILASF